MKNRGTWSMIGRQHTEIFRAIKDHDPEAAYAAMKRHITFVLNFVQEKRVLGLLPVQADTGRGRRNCFTPCFWRWSGG